MQLTECQHFIKETERKSHEKKSCCFFIPLFDSLPQWLASAGEKAYELLAHTKDARLSDGALDRALLETLISMSKKSGSAFLVKYFNTMTFYADIKISPIYHIGLSASCFNYRFCNILYQNYCAVLGRIKGYRAELLYDKILLHIKIEGQIHAALKELP